MREYYCDDAFKERMLEYIEDSVYLVGFGKYLEKNHFQLYKSVRPTQLDWMLDRNLDGFTSVWQKNSYLIVLDLEYYNPFDYSEVFQDEEGVFGRMEGFCKAVEDILDGYGIEYIKLMTGQGYHYASRIREGTPAFEFIKKHGVCSETTHEKNPDVPRDHNLMQDAIGKLMEFLYQKVFETYDGHLRPKDIRLDSAMMVMDLDQWADPLFMRDVRLAFSSHQKHIMTKYINRMGSDWCAKNVPIGYSIPCDGLTLKERIGIRRNREKVIELAKRSDVHIPNGSEGWLRMFEDYVDSPLNDFHKRFDSVSFQDVEALDTGRIPESCAHILEDSTKVRWTEIKKICDKAYSEGIGAVETAKLFAELFMSHPQWGIHWVEYDPEMRAKYWVRVFYGMNETMEGYKPLLE